MPAVVPTTIIGYIRVSTDEQSLSVEAQHQALAHWCQSQQTLLLAVYEDVGVSGSMPRKSALACSAP